MTALITHAACLDHEMQPGHPERPGRLSVVLDHLRETGLADDLETVDAPLATREQLAAVHRADYLRTLERATPRTGLVRLDADTALGPHSLRAARAVAGAAVAGVDRALRPGAQRSFCAVRPPGASRWNRAASSSSAQRSFCAVRPPGHHAEPAAAMGFCLLNGAAVAAAHALTSPAVDRVAVLDFDVHHGNGTVAMFMDDPRVLVCSSFQFPHYPNRLHDVDRPNIVCTPLPAGTKGPAFRAAVERDWLPALEAFQPQLVVVSAGFDAHALDPLGDLLLTEDDFAWVTRFVTAAADRYADGRVVSILEGGYHAGALARSAAAHVAALAA